MILIPNVVEIHVRWWTQNNFCHCIYEGCFNDTLCYKDWFILIPISSLRIKITCLHEGSWKFLTIVLASWMEHSNEVICTFVLYTTAKITDSGLDDDIVEDRVPQSDFRRAVSRLYDAKVFDVEISKRCNKCVSFALVMPVCIT